MTSVEELGRYRGGCALLMWLSGLASLLLAWHFLPTGGETYASSSWAGGIAGIRDPGVHPGIDVAGTDQSIPARLTVGETIPWLEFDDKGVVVGTVLSNTFALEVADLDNDGDVDVISGDQSGEVTVWENDGTPFTDAWQANQIGVVALPVALSAGDLDNDGDIDLAVAHAGGPTIFENSGSPFAGGWSARQIGYRTLCTIRIADMDGDGRLDLVTGGGLPWWRQPDDGNWITVWHAPVAPFVHDWSMTDVGLAYYTPTGLGVGDLDSDGDLDIVIGTDHAPPVGSAEEPIPREDWPDVYQLRAFRHDPGGEWTEYNLGRDPLIETLPYVGYHGYWGASVTDVELADLDEDGHLDIITTERVEGDFLVMGWQNDGTPFSGELWAPSAIAKGPVHNWLEDSVLWAETGDFDLDGDLDVVSGSRAELEIWPLNLWENTGVAFGSEISDTPWVRRVLSLRREDLWTGKAVDLDQDGDLDLVTASHPLVAGVPSTIRAWENASLQVEVFPAAQDSPSGGVLTYTVTVEGARGFQHPVDLWVSGLPIGAEVTWDQNPLLPGGSTTLTFVIPPRSASRHYSMTVVGIGGSFVRSDAFGLSAGPGYPVYLPLVRKGE